MWMIAETCGRAMASGDFTPYSAHETALAPRPDPGRLRAHVAAPRALPPLRHEARREQRRRHDRDDERRHVRRRLRVQRPRPWSEDALGLHPRRRWPPDR